MRERKSPLGATDEVEARESGRLGAAAVAGASEARAGRAAGAVALGRVVLDGFRRHVSQRTRQ
jgi:hypothetical protein